MIDAALEDDVCGTLKIHKATGGPEGGRRKAEVYVLSEEAI
jgi:hypothetical protein